MLWLLMNVALDFGQRHGMSQPWGGSWNLTLMNLMPSREIAFREMIGFIHLRNGTWPTSRKCGSQVNLSISVFSLKSHLYLVEIGCHADIGGGSHHNRLKSSLCFIPLRWMIKEAIIAGTGILFKKYCLKSLNFDFVELASELDRVGLDVKRTGLDPALLESPVVQPMPSPSTPEGLLSPIFSPTSQISFPFVPFAVPNTMVALLDQGQRRLIDAVQHVMGVGDAISKVYDQLFEAKHWWILENIPTLTMYQEPTGDWTRKRM